jgi:hypothetical protein
MPSWCSAPRQLIACRSFAQQYRQYLLRPGDLVHARQYYSKPLRRIARSMTSPAGGGLESCQRTDGMGDSLIPENAGAGLGHFVDRRSAWCCVRSNSVTAAEMVDLENAQSKLQRGTADRQSGRVLRGMACLRLADVLTQRGNSARMHARGPKGGDHSPRSGEQLNSVKSGATRVRSPGGGREWNQRA